MNRSKFLASLAAMFVAPFVKADTPVKTVPPPMPTFNRRADLDRGHYKCWEASPKITVLHIPGEIPDGMTEKEVFDLYHQTGTLVWKNKPGGPVEFKPYTIIKDSRDGKV